MGLISLAIQHTPWRPERVSALYTMQEALRSPTGLTLLRSEACPKDMPWCQFKTILAQSQWDWALNQSPDFVSHHLFLSDDLHIMPRFWEALHAMIAAKPTAIIGLLSNHPKGPALSDMGAKWYRCNSWIVGPAYLVPRVHLEPFSEWYRALPDNDAPGGKQWFNDDSALNEWITSRGPRESWHPLPTIIEHRYDVKSTVGHGDRYSRERVSWRERRDVVEDEEGWRWLSEPDPRAIEPLTRPEYWDADGEMLRVGEG